MIVDGHRKDNCIVMLVCKYTAAASLGRLESASLQYRLAISLSPSTLLALQNGNFPSVA